MLIGIDASRAFVTERTGTENYAYELITQILRLPAAKKHNFVLFTRPNAKVPNEIDGYSNVNIKRIGFWVLWTQVGLALSTWGSKLDVLWIPSHTLPVLRKRGIKTVVTIHGLEYKYLPQYNNWLQRWYLPLSTYYAAVAADRLICVSQSTKRDLVEETQIDTKKTIVIHEGVSFSDNQKTQRSRVSESRIYQKYGIDRGKYILFVGTVQPRKNLKALIMAFRLIYKDNKDIKLVLAGKVGWGVEAEMALPDKLGMAEAVIWTGRVEPEVLEVLYQGAVVYVQPSHTEGFGLPVLEAMNAGVCVVSSDGGALPEVVGDGGVVVPLGEGFESKLAMSITKLLANPQQRQKLRVLAKKRVRSLTWQIAAAKTLPAITNIG